MQVIKYPPKESWDSLTNRPLQGVGSLETAVRDIVEKVRLGGDEAVLEFTRLFDGIKNQSLVYKVPDEEPSLPEDLKQAIRTAYNNIEKFHLSQQEELGWIETMPGVRCCRKSTPIDKVGLYVPGGSAPLFSSLLMLGIPAKLAGCEDIVVCTPPQPDGQIHPAVTYVAYLLGLEQLHPVGGAQAIAAMAFGTESISRVYKILGPGNQYVTMAKQLVGHQVAIDFPAGPSEVAVLADQLANPEYIAADLLSQAEHGPDSQVVLATDSESLIEAVVAALDRQLEDLPRKDMAKTALDSSKLLVFDDLSVAMDFINTYAPEHLILNVKDATDWMSTVTNAGSVFIGAYTPESAGDYASGTNHTLPTNGNARMYAGVSLDTFVKKITFQEISKQGLEVIGSTIETMARAEGLEAHRNAVAIRRKNKKSLP